MNNLRTPLSLCIICLTFLFPIWNKPERNNFKSSSYRYVSVTTYNDCNEVLKHGIFNTTIINHNTSFRKTFEKYLYKKDFGTHDEAINAGISVGVPVYGIPIEFGGTFTREQKDTWRKQHQEYSNETLSELELIQVLKKDINPIVIKAWLSCMVDRKTYGLLMSTDKQGDVVNVKVSWNDLPNSKTSKPKVLSSVIINGKNVSDNSQQLFKPKKLLLNGDQSNQVLVEPIDVYKDVYISLTTDRGTVTAFALGKPRKPSINFDATNTKVNFGDNIELYWKVDYADKVEITNVETASRNGKTLVVANQEGIMEFILKASNEQGGYNEETVRVGVRERPYVTSIVLSGMTGDEDKDDNTNLTLRIDGTSGQLAFGNDKTHHWANKKPFSLVLTLSKRIIYSDISSGKAVFGFDADGDDTWKFDADLTISWSDDTTSKVSLGSQELEDEEGKRDLDVTFACLPGKR